MGRGGLMFGSWWTDVWVVGREEEEDAEIRAALSMRQMMAKARGDGSGRPSNPIKGWSLLTSVFPRHVPDFRGPGEHER